MTTHHDSIDPPPYDTHNSSYDTLHTPTGNQLSTTNKISAYLNTRFDIDARDSTVATEIRSGIVTFVTMAYILVVNPAILSKASTQDPNGSTNDEFPFNNIATATALSAALGSLLAGLYGNLPFGLAPGMGLNSYFTYGVCYKLGLSWRIALTCTFIQGILFIILSLSGACSLIQLYAPPAIKKSITLGLGLFQALIGFEVMRLVVPGADGTLLALGDLTDLSIWLALFGLFIISALLILDVKAAMLIGITVITVLSYITGEAAWPKHYMNIPSVRQTLFPFDFAGYFDEFATCLSVTLVFLFVSVFDTAGVQFACGTAANLLDENGHLPGSTAAFCSAGVATTFGACLGTSPVIIHNETCAGIADGGRTGLSGCTVALCFLLCTPFIPLLESVPAVASAAPLVIVGMLMMQMCAYIDWQRIDQALPAFLTASLIPFTYSIMNGMLAGFIAYVVLYIVARLAPSQHVDTEYTPAEPMTPSKLNELEAATPLLGLSSPWKRSTSINSNTDKGGSSRRVTINNQTTVLSPIKQHSYAQSDFLGVSAGSGEKYDRKSYGSTYQNMLPVI